MLTSDSRIESATIWVNIATFSKCTRHLLTLKPYSKLPNCCPAASVSTLFVRYMHYCLSVAGTVISHNISPVQNSAGSILTPYVMQH